MLNVLRFQASRWSKWQNKSTGRQIFVAMATIGFGTLLVKVAAFIKELIVAYQFGTSSALDAFLIAYLLPSFAVTVIAGSISSALIPTYVQVREGQGLKKAYELLGSVVCVAFIFLLLMSAVLALTISYVLPVLGSGFTDEKLKTTQLLFFLVLPCLLLSGIAMVWSSVLNAGERFALVAMVPVVTPLAIIVVLFTLTTAWGIYALAAGTLLGAIGELVLLLFAVRTLGIPVRPRWNGVTAPVKQVARQYAPMIAGAVLMGGTLLVDQAMAAMLSPGSVAAFNYGCKLVFLAVGLASLALGTAVLPYFSKMTARADWRGIRQILKSYGGLVAGISIPVTLLLMYFSQPIIELLFQRGQFTTEDAKLVAEVQLLYLPQLPFYLFSILLVRLISALKANHILMWISALNLCVNITLNYVFMQWIGLPGIALSTSVVYALSTGLLVLVLGLRFRKA